MLNMDIRVLDTKDQDVKVTYIMREICRLYDEAKYMKFEEEYSDQFTLEELIASCAVSGGIEFFQKYGKKSELTYIKIEKAE